MKTYPKIGDKLFLSQSTGNSWVDMVKYPYTVIAVTPKIVYVQKCRLIAPIDPATGDRVFYYDTVAEKIENDPKGTIEELTWHAKREKWGTKGRDSDYPAYAYFGEWRHQPYLN